MTTAPAPDVGRAPAPTIGAGAAPMDLLADAEAVEGVPARVAGWTTTRQCGSFGLSSHEPVGDVMDRWYALERALNARGITRLATGHQVHGAEIGIHEAGWRGWLRMQGIDGHFTAAPGTALAVTIADCTPVLIWHPRGAIAALHAGWRGTAAGILRRGLALFDRQGFASAECSVYLGPAISGPAYQVGPEVIEAVTGRAATSKECLDVRDVLEADARRHGVARILRSPACTRTDAHRFFSHRRGDAGRQLAIIGLVS